MNQEYSKTTSKCFYISFILLILSPLLSRKKFLVNVLLAILSQFSKTVNERAPKVWRVQWMHHTFSRGGFLITDDLSSYRNGLTENSVSPCTSPGEYVIRWRLAYLNTQLAPFPINFRRISSQNRYKYNTDFFWSLLSQYLSNNWLLLYMAIVRNNPRTTYNSNSFSSCF